ncbi:hypothetical protein CVT24_003662 [Panaeolus cyanescens]|uniref:WSC domain-containing protein n=1 Tax=Panaeolus cyanescens TaxID=181874 RepID=A0A409WCA3_9AGAR|nr:hypothetical protein CVT24_003662 [Panaeolus cyanescens]
MFAILFSDSTNSRSLKVASFTSVDDMTIESCLNFCQSGGFNFAGVEFARECFCDNIVEPPAAPISSSGCNMTCTGNSAEICGGPDAINVFTQSKETLPGNWSSIGDSTSSRSLKVASFTSVDDMTIESCLDFCQSGGFNFAGVEFARQCFCDNVVEPPAVPISGSGCNMTCTGNPTEICGGPDAINVFTQSNGPLPAGWTSIGCFSDSTSSRSLKVASFTSVDNMTVESCLAFCTPSGFNFAGVEFARECFCDNVIESPGAPIPHIGCNMTCTGNPTEICGGPDAINVFSHSAASTPTPTISTTPAPASTTAAPVATPTIPLTAGTFEYKGCFQDVVLTNFRTLGTQVTVPGAFNVEGCTAACKAAGFPLAGLEFGQECWCDTYMEIVSPAPDSDCNKVCVGDATELCGTGNRLAVYQDTTATPPNTQTCLHNFQLPLIRVTLQWVPTTGGTASQITGLVITGNDSVVSLTTEKNTIALTDNLNGEAKSFITTSELHTDLENLNVLGSAVAPAIGGAQFLITDVVGAIVTNAFEGYCAQPNPVSQFGPFIGPAVLSVNGHADQWALCNNVTSTNTFGSRFVVFSPIATNPDYDISQCEDIFIQLQITLSK